MLSALAMQMEADPFIKVKKMVADLISKLKAQEAEEEDHKKWCDDELSKNKKTRTEKSKEVETLTSTVDELESRLAVLKKDLVGLSKDIANINGEVAEASEARAKEKDINEATIVEAVTGQTAIAQAKQILSEFFDKAAANTAFAQAGMKDPPIFDAAFKGQQTQGNNVIAFLDVISSDFARLESETKKAEDTAQAEHDTFMADSKKQRKPMRKRQRPRRSRNWRRLRPSPTPTTTSSPRRSS